MRNDVQPIAIMLAMFAGWYIVFRYLKPNFVVTAVGLVALVGGYSTWLLVQGRTSVAIIQLVILAVALALGGRAHISGR